MRVEINMRTGHSFWAKNRQNSDVINIQELLKDYWGSKERVLTVLSQSRPLTGPSILTVSTEAVAIGKYHGALELRFSANTDVGVLSTAHPTQLMIFA